MSDVEIRIEGCAGRITLNRPNALNALTHQMSLDIEAALDLWAQNDAVRLLIIDAEGDKAFCAGGDIADLYRTGQAGDFDYGRRFWQDEYRMNAKLFRFPKPVVTFLNGFVMGGGVGVGCHGSHRIVCETTKIAMPECGIGLVPDVGGSLLLAQAPGRLGEYLGTTGARMGPEDAIYSEFADYSVNFAQWDAIKLDLCKRGSLPIIDEAHVLAKDAPLKSLQSQIDAVFDGERFYDVLQLLRRASAGEDPSFAEATLTTLSRNAPLSMACTIEMVHRLRGPSATIERALDMEYRFTARAMEHGDFLEGVRAAIIDKDRSPSWQHSIDGVPSVAVSKMLQPLGPAALNLEDPK